MNKLINLLSKREIKEFIIFSCVGLSGFVIEIAIFNIALYFEISPLFSAALSMPLAATSNWFLNRKFTFKLASKERPAIQWSQYLVVSGIGMLINLAIFWTGYKYFGLNSNLSKIGATFIVWFWNFFLNKLWTFKTKH